MRVFKQVRALALCFAILAPVASNAETRLSEKNDPGVLLSAEIDAILTQDHKAIKRSGGFLARLFKGTPKQPDIYYDEAWVNALPVASGDANWQCLTEALYFEARGEDVTGQFAVAEVILNRVDSGRFPGSVCKVVNQGSGGAKHKCQFSYTCDGLAEAVHEPEAWEQVGKIARLMLDGAPRRLTHGATYYHNAGVSPGWSRKFKRVAEVGPHFFYRVNG
jgi:spore germination cell wall hydrolase CwlJ-like protein